MEDEAGFHRQPTVAGQWAAAGRRQPRAPYSTRANGVVRAAVAFDPVGGRLVHRLRSAFTAVEMGRFYKWIGTSLNQAERIYVVMDNWPVHDHPRARAYLNADPRLQILWLPTYAPWLNPAEKVWKWVRQRLTHMHPWASDMPTLRTRIDQLLSNASPAELLSYTGTGHCNLYSS